MRRSALLGFFALIAAALPVAAPAQAAGPDVPLPPPFLAADVSQPGMVNLFFYGPPGSSVVFSERIGGALHPLGASSTNPAGGAQLLRATTWSCTRTVRQFEAATGAGTWGFTVRTPSCRDRLEVEAPPRVKPGRAARILIRDRWTIGGVRASLCLKGPRASRCSRIVIPRGAAQVAPRPKFAPGRWTVEVQLGRHRVVQSLVSGPGRAPKRITAPILLATGDSTIQGIDSYLSDGLGSAFHVESQYRVGTGISKDEPAPTWTQFARDEASQVRPEATAISIGANEGFAMSTPSGGTVKCCGEDWVTEYVRRVRDIMESFGRSGTARVLWLTLPAPRSPEVAAITASVNAAIARAATGLSYVRLVPIDQIITPGFRFRETGQFGGKEVVLREPDGIHLSPKGTEIAADAVRATLRAWK